MIHLVQNQLSATHVPGSANVMTGSVEGYVTGATEGSQVRFHTASHAANVSTTGTK